MRPHRNRLNNNYFEWCLLQLRGSLKHVIINNVMLLSNNGEKEIPKYTDGTKCLKNTVNQSKLVEYVTVCRKQNKK